EGIAALSAQHPARLLGADGITEAEVAYSIRTERARHLEDVLERRSRLWLDAEAMRHAAEPVSRWMAPHLGWDEPTRGREVKQVLDALDRERAIVERGTS
ncbi:MAG TPA: glycerol-3-phosphate dehydrogenase C-terminal domain-containing protein, partial [Candidatus Angelobacter sp.]|nr:glycerol-3-phosphate dehydrogenase C-terminal domain-containing protein [Candidatus Angelobacter sp.]